jgi:hypothetical protein
MTTLPETITIGESAYHVLFPDLVRPLTESEKHELRESIKEHGIMIPVEVDEENGIIDGANRTRIAAELGLEEIPIRTVKYANDEEKRQRALTVNITRRHLAPEEREKLIAARRDRVHKARQTGKSTRQIAEDEGVSQTQVMKDLTVDAGEHSCSPETPPVSTSMNGAQAASDNHGSPNTAPPAPTETSTPVKVNGRDGKCYASTRNPGKREKGK